MRLNFEFSRDEEEWKPRSGGGQWMENDQEETSGVRRILVKPA
jgi:hypothetical protein